MDAVIGGGSPGARQMISLHRTLLKLLRRRRLRADLEAELAHHRELTREHGNAAGLGNTTAVKESALDLWRFTLLENAWRDLRFAARGLRRNRAFTITAVLSLALGIGVSTAMFTVLNAVAIRPLPYSNPEQLRLDYPGAEGEQYRRNDPHAPTFSTGGARTGHSRAWLRITTTRAA